MTLLRFQQIMDSNDMSSDKQLGTVTIPLAGLIDGQVSLVPSDEIASLPSALCRKTNAISASTAAEWCAT